MLPTLVAVGALLLTGCTGADTSRPTAAPALGGEPVPAREPPAGPMDRLERPVAERLAAHVRGHGLRLDYLDCPRWDGTVPSRMTCRGYLDGVVADVGVHLTSAVAGRAVSFHAQLEGGLVATRALADRLRADGWREVDCGDAVAYPATVGRRVVCRVARDGRSEYVVATVRDWGGAVTITGYAAAR